MSKRINTTGEFYFGVFEEKSVCVYIKNAHDPFFQSHHWDYIHINVLIKNMRIRGDFRVSEITNPYNPAELRLSNMYSYMSDVRRIISSIRDHIRIIPNGIYHRKCNVLAIQTRSCHFPLTCI